MSRPILPTIHSNGTSPEDLRDKATTAGQRITDALAALSETSPNARDYYPQGEGAYKEALEAHEKRFRALCTIRDDMAELAEWCQDTIDDRAELRKG